MALSGFGDEVLEDGNDDLGLIGVDSLQMSNEAFEGGAPEQQIQISKHLMVNKIISRILRRNGSEKKKMSIINKNLLYKPDHGVLSVHAVGRRPVVLVHV